MGLDKSALGNAERSPDLDGSVQGNFGGGIHSKLNSDL